MALYKHCRFDVDHEGIPDENDDFAEFRMKVSDTIKDVVFIIGTDHCIKNVSINLPFFTCSKDYMNG